MASSARSIQSIALLSANGGIDLSTGNADGNGTLVLRSGGSLKLDTSGNNNNILVDSGTGDLLTNVGTNTLSAIDDTIAAIGLSATRGGITLSSSSANGNGDIRILSGGTLRLSTSANNSNILLQAGSGNINLSSTGTITLTGNTSLNNGTLRLNGLTYTFPGADTANGVLISNGSGLLSWNTIGASNVTADSLDFTEFKDEMTLDADTSINGDYSLIVRAGLGSIQNSTSGSNDLQLSAEDKLILAGASFDLSTSNGAVDIISNQRLDLSAGGTLTLDTSANNTNIVLTPGTGNIGIGSTAPIYKLDVNGTLRTTSTARIEGALTVTTGGASVTGDLTLDGDLDFTGAQNITTTADNLTLSPTGNLIIDTSGGTVSIRDAAIDLTSQPTTLSASTLTLRSTGTFIIDTSASNTNIALQAGTGGLTGSLGTINLTAINDSVSALYLNSQRGGITLSSANASGNGPIKILSGGSLQLSTSQGNQPIYLQAGSGNVQVSGNQLYLTGNLVVTGTETFNGVAYTFPGADGSASNVLTTSGTGLLSWGTLGAASITADSLDFTEFKDSMNLDADTSINGPYSFIVRAGNAARQNATSGNNDLQLSAEDQILIHGTALTLETSSATAGQMLLRSDGSMTFDTSGGTGKFAFVGGNVGIGTTSPLAKLQIESTATGNTTLLRLRTNPASGGIYDGIDWLSNTLATPIARVAMTTGADGGRGELSFWTSGVSGTLTEAVRINESGNVGIGTTGPQGILDVIGNSSVLLRAGQSSLQLSGSAASTTADIQLAAADRIDLFAGSLSLQTSSTSAGDLKIISKGSLILDTSSSLGGSAPIIMNGNVGIGNTAPGIKLDVTGDIASVTSFFGSGNSGLVLSGTNTRTSAPASDVSSYIMNTFASTGSYPFNAIGHLAIQPRASRDIVFMTGATTQNVRMIIDNTGNIGIGTTSPLGTLDVIGNQSVLLRAGQSSLQLSGSAASTTADIQLAAADRIDLFAGSLSLQTSSQTAGELKLMSKGSLILDTSGAAGGGAPIALQAGSGNINLSSTGTITLTGNTSLNNGTLRLNGLTYTFPGSDTANGVLISNGSGLLSWSTIGGSNVTNDSLDFTEFKDSMNLDADTSINGPYSFIVRAGNAARQNATSGSNDLQLAAEDAMILDADDFTLITSNTGVSSLQLISKGVLRLDTSTNNNNILLLPGTGNVGIGTTGPTSILAFGGDAARTIQLEARTTNAVGNALSIVSGAAGAGATVFTGGQLNLMGGAAAGTTGAATGGDVIIAGGAGITNGFGNVILNVNSGKVGIGTTGPGSKLDVAGTVNIDGNTVIGKNEAVNHQLQLFTGVSNDSEIHFYPYSNYGFKLGNYSVSGERYFQLKNNNGDAVISVGPNNTGNVGIGTTSPLGILDVLGSCVTGDTLLPIRRRRRRRRRKDSLKLDDLEGLDLEDGGLDTLTDQNIKTSRVQDQELQSSIFKNINDEYDYLLCRIDQVLPGDEVLSLNEATGALEYARINKLMDMGIKSIYELATVGGKKIRTTGLHPYLVAPQNSFGPANTNSLYEKTFRDVLGLGRRFYHQVLEQNPVYSPALDAPVWFTHDGWNHLVEDSRTKFEVIARVFALPKALFVLGQCKKLIEKKPRIFKHDGIITKLWAIQGIVEGTWIKVIVRQKGDNPKHLLSVIWKGEEARKEVKSAIKKGAVSRLYPRCQAFAFNAWDKYTIFIRSLSRQEKTPIARGSHGSLIQTVKQSLSDIVPFVKSGKWVKVNQLKVGQMIAAEGQNGKPVFEKIVSIKKLKAEQVYDIEIEGTHNFVGNGIVAHNTSGILMRAGAASLQLSSSATSTTADIELAAADQIDLFAGRFSLTTSSGTAGDVKIDSAGTLTLSTSRNNTNVALLSGSGAFNVTAGTTTQTYSGNNQNAILLQASNGGIQLSTGSVGNGSLRLLSSGSLTIETSQNNTNIALLPGTGGVALGISTPNSSATLDLSSTTKGLLPPRMTTAQRDAISSPTKGLVIFNDTTAALNVYSGSAWGAVGSGGGGGSCNGSNDCIVVLTPEYGNAIISADGTNNVGTVTSDLTISASNYYYNYYEFSSGQASLQDYDVYVSWQLPSGWLDWDDAANAISVDLATEDSSSANTKVDATIYRQGDADSYSETANVSPTAGEWRTTLEGKSVLDITKTNLNTIATWAAGDVMVIKFKLYSKDNYYSRIGNVRIIYENQ